MAVRLCTTEDDLVAWDRFVFELPGAQYFQSYGWLRSYEPLGFTPQVLLHEANGVISGGVAFLSVKLPVVPWRLFVIPHGPLPAHPAAEAWLPLMETLDRFCLEHGAIYAQIYPHESSEQSVLLSQIEALGFTHPAMLTSHRFSSTPVVIDLMGKSEEDVLCSLRRKTRQYVRHALRSELVLRTQVSDPIWDQICELLEENGRLMGYRPRPHASLRAAWDWFAPKGWATFVQAWHGEVLVGTILLIFTGRTAYYLAGAVRRGFEEHRPAEFLHWHGIREAMKRQMERYDLVNISTSGVEQFKRGFRPQVHVWHQPRTKLYAPVAARLVTAAERHLRPLVRGAVRRRATAPLPRRNGR